jgi:hypothetical protein
MFGNISLKALLAAGAMALVAGGASSATVNTPYTLVGTYDGNDCSGVLGQGFENCAYNGSPVIAKYNTGEDGGWELNTGTFPGIDSDMFTLTGTSGSSGLWSYLGTTGVAITAFVLKAGNEFSIYKMNTPGTSFSNIDWSTVSGKDLSHITFYDTAAPVPLPAAGFLMIGALGGLAALRRRRRAV